MQQQTSPALSLNNVYQPEYIADPYPLYQRLRETDPVFWDETLNAWVLTSYADAVVMLRDPRFSAVRFVTDTNQIPPEVVEALGSPMRALTRQMLFLDPPDHTRLRGLVAKAFTPRVVEAMRTHIQEIVDRLLDAAQSSGQIELMGQFANPLPAIVIAEMLGVPAEDRDKFTVWSAHFGSLLEGKDMTMEEMVQAFLGVSAFMDYFRGIIAARRTTPKDDLLQAMIDAEEGGDVLGEEELLGNCVLILAAGHITTTHLIGNGMLALLNNPEQYELLKHNPDIVSLAVMELLRYDGPVQATGRVLKEDLTLRDKQLKAGQHVVASLGAANHDPAQFAAPDSLDVSRVENRHLAFGQGVHFCLGAPLARLEAEVAFSTRVRRLRNPRLVEDVQWYPGMVFRGLQSLVIAFD
ncbi:MAG: cytochrome P450 [Chloroflexi bacterium]|nr:MAG: cytochrome P450 [Chloroflexota bacterium]